MSPPTTRHQQLILLDHDKADMLDALARNGGVPKQTLLREAVDILLGMAGAPYGSPRVDVMKNRLMTCELAMTKALKKGATQEDIQRYCAETRVMVHLVLEDIGAPKESRISYSGPAKGRR
jgi:hypothetical protein